VREAEKPKGPKAPRAGKAGTKVLTLHYVRSKICSPEKQKATIRGLGFTRLGQRVVRPDDPAIRGMVQHVRHLVEIEED
jgi:large subunit ribosomal protein L30